MQSENMWWVAIEDRPVTRLDTESAERAVMTNPSAMLWWNGISDWVQASVWLEMRGEITFRREKIFFLGHEPHIPRTLSETLELVEPSREFVAAINFYCPETGKNKSIFEIPEICRELGLKPRRNVRTKTKGHVLLKSGSQRALASLSTLSIGGIGAIVNSSFDLTGRLSVTVDSPDLPEITEVEAQMIYRKDNFVGLQFSEIDEDLLSSIARLVDSREGAVLHF